MQPVSPKTSRISRMTGAMMMASAAFIAAAGNAQADDTGLRLNSIDDALARNPAPGHPPGVYVTGDIVKTPFGYAQWCARALKHCKDDAVETAGDIAVLTDAAWEYLQAVNKYWNETIKPVTDQKHFGVIERWQYPTDNRGDCEDYVLIKRKTLIEAGWPREALLITLVRDKAAGHAVLTVKTDRGDFVLDNQRDEILLQSQTDYKFVKMQDPYKPNVWRSLLFQPQSDITAGINRLPVNNP